MVEGPVMTCAIFLLANNYLTAQFNVIDPSKNNRNVVVAVSNQKTYPASVEIPINDTAACIYFLHTAGKPSSENVAGAVKILYGDGSSNFQYMIMEKQLTYWWFSELKTDHSGIAWYGKNDVSEGIGLSWYAMDNPQPQKKIKSIVISASQNVMEPILQQIFQFHFYKIL